MELTVHPALCSSVDGTVQGRPTFDQLTHKQTTVTVTGAQKEVNKPGMRSGSDNGAVRKELFGEEVLQLKGEKEPREDQRAGTELSRQGKQQVQSLDAGARAVLESKRAPGRS